VTLDDPRATPERQKAALLLKQAADIQQNKSRSADAAATLLERALELTPEDRELPLALADAYLAAHRTSDAQDLLLRLIESVGERRTKQRALCHQKLGWTLRELGDPAGALDHFRQACRVAPSASMLYDLGVIAFETDRLGLARKTFEWLLLQLGGGPKAEVFHYLAQISRKQGDREKAICFYEAGLQDAKRTESAQQSVDYRPIVATTSG
jgi:tetratricopeptide (TPR) repeat protein